MLAAEYYDFHNSLRSRGIIFSFVGYVSEGILFSLGESLRQKMAIEETDANIAKRVFSVFVEQVQNVVRYSAHRIGQMPPSQIELSSGVIAVGAEDGRFFVVCANAMRSSDVPRLRERLESLSAMDKDAIKKFYRQKLKEPPEDESKGATLGLIEIARRTSEPLEFAFMNIDDETSFFCLKAHI